MINLVTGDVFRPCENQEHNIKRLFYILKSSNLFKNLHCISSIKNTFKTREHYLHALFDNKINFIDELFSETTFLAKSTKKVITFEANQKMLRELDQSGYSYIDFRTSPHRYMDDLTFCYKTNSRDQAEAFKGLELDQNTKGFYCNIMKAKMCYPTGFVFLPDSLIILEQSPHDSSLITPQGFLSLDLYKDELKKLKEQYRKCYIKLRPGSNAPDESNIQLIRELGLEIIPQEISIYWILANIPSATIYGISSSALYEAREFGLRTIQKLDPLVGYKDLQIHALLKCPSKNMYREIYKSYWGYPT